MSEAKWFTSKAGIDEMRGDIDPGCDGYPQWDNDTISEMLDAIDTYRSALAKYMRHVKLSEGTTFVWLDIDEWAGFGGVVMTEDEHAVIIDANERCCDVKIVDGEW